MSEEEAYNTAATASSVSVDDSVSEDETECRVDDDGIPVVIGAKFKQGAPSKNTPLSLLNDAKLGFVPSTRLFAVCMLWSPQRKRAGHFFADAFFSQKVFSEELRMSFFDFLAVRGWVVKNPKKSDELDIYYRRLPAESLHPRHNQMMATLERVYSYLQSPDAFRHIPEKHDDPVVPKMRQFPIFGNSKLIDICQKEQITRPGNRYLLEHQHLQLALDTIEVSFVPIMTPSKQRNRLYHEKLFGLIFKDCKTRRQLLEGLQAILMYCKDDRTIKENKSTLRSWLDKPTEILTLARTSSEISTILEEGYSTRVWQSLRHVYGNRSSMDHTYRSTERRRLVVQMVVYTKLKILKGTNAVPVTPLISSSTRSNKKRNNIDLAHTDLAETDLAHSSNRNKAAKVVVPDRVLNELSAMPTVLQDAAGITNNQPQVEDETTTPPAALTPIPSWSIPYDDVSRWNKEICRMATLTEMRSVSARLVMNCPHYDIWLHHSPFELYVAWELQDISHQFVVQPKKDPSEFASSIQAVRRAIHNIPDIGDLYMMPPYFIVARPGSCQAFDQAFTPEFFKIDFVRLVQFIFKHGDNDPKRSTRRVEITLPMVGMRVDFGNSGQAMEEPGGPYRPKTLCGREPFDKEGENGETIRGLLGQMVDGICNCSHYLSENCVGRSSSVMNQRRFTEFASELRDFLYAKDSDVEWITLQLLNLSHYQGGEVHTDISNDPREGYNRTMCLCLHFIDWVGDLWSLKIITGFRKRIGDYFDGKMGKLVPLKSTLVLYTTRIDAGYIDILRSYKGNYIPPSIPSWKKPQTMWLDDDMPYEVKFLMGGHEIESFNMIAGTTISNWFSAALTGAYLLAPSTSVLGMVQLAVIAACQNSFEHYHIVTRHLLSRSITENKNNLAASRDNYPMLRYCDTCTRLFSNQAAGFGMELVGGDYAPPRFAPVSFDFRTVIGSDRQKVDLLVDELTSLLRSVNGLLGSQSLEVSRSTLDSRLNYTSKRIGEVLPGCELSPMRLVLFLEFCAHLNMGLFQTKKIRNLFYPMPGTASHRFILDNQFEDSQADEICFFLKSEFSTPSREVFMDEIEPMLCAAASSEIVEDTYIKGQYLFRLDEHGVAWMQVYKAVYWMRVPAIKDDELESNSDSY